MNLIKREFIALFSAIAGLCCFGADYITCVEEAEREIAKGNYELAGEWLKEAMTTEPSNPSNVLLLSNLGMVQFYAGNDSLALGTLSQARAMAPGSVTILANRARVLDHMGRRQDAMADLSLAIATDSTYAPAYYERGTLRLDSGDFAGAEADMARHRALRPKSRQSLLALALIYSSTGRGRDAVAAYTELLKGKPDADLLAARAMCRMDLGDLPEAAEDIQEGLKIAPEEPGLYLCRARLNRLRYREADAAADERRAEELMRGTPFQKR